MPVLCLDDVSVTCRSTTDKYGRRIYEFDAMYDGRSIGQVIVDRNNYVIVSEVYQGYRRKGVGLKMYQCAIKKLGSLGTWGGTLPARKIWSKLSLIYSVMPRACGYKLKNKKIRHEIH